jgi:4-amino-4-deoxy-L-arabinose transferase-like glycosyltransferase
MMATTPQSSAEQSTYFGGTKAILGFGFELIAFLFAGFSGFFESIAPPDPQESRFAIGLASFLALAFLLFIAALARKSTRELKKWWILAFLCFVIVGFGSGFLYKQFSEEYSFSYPPENQSRNTIGGVTMLPEAAEKMHSSRWSKGRLLAEYGPDNFDQIWSPESVITAKRRLTDSYVGFIVGVAAALFCVIEGLMRQPVVGQNTPAQGGNPGQTK